MVNLLYVAVWVELRRPINDAIAECEMKRESTIERIAPAHRVALALSRHTVDRTSFIGGGNEPATPRNVATCPMKDFPTFIVIPSVRRKRITFSGATWALN